MMGGESLYVTHTYLQFLSNIFLAIFEAKPKCTTKNNCYRVAMQSGSEILDAEWIQPLTWTGYV